MKLPVLRHLLRLVWLTVAVIILCSLSMPGPSLAAPDIEMRMSTAGFRPKVVRLTEGRKVSIRVTNQSSKAHNLVIPDFYIYTYNLAPGESTVVGFTPSKTGKFPFYSDTPGTIESGFEGTIIVQ